MDSALISPYGVENVTNTLWLMKKLFLSPSPIREEVLTGCEVYYPESPGSTSDLLLSRAIQEMKVSAYIPELNVQ